MEPRKSQFRDKLSGSQFGSLDQSLVISSAQDTFASINTANDQADIVAFQQTWGAMHAPVFGQVIPNTVRVESTNVEGDGTIITEPSNNQVFKIFGVSVTDVAAAGTNNVAIFLRYSNVDLLLRELALSSGDNAVLITPPAGIFIDKNSTLYVTSDAEAAFNVGYCKVVQ